MPNVTAKVFMKHVVKYWGLPTSIISERDSRFTRRFWQELLHLMETKLKTSTIMHPQIDGQTEHIKNILKIYACHYMAAN